MSNSIAVGRRLAARIIVVQIGASALVAMAFVVAGWPSVLAALCAGLAVAVGNGLLALRLFAAVPARAGLALTRLVAGTALRWLAIIGGLYLVVGVFHLPPLPGLCGFAVAMLMQLVGLRLKLG